MHETGSARFDDPRHAKLVVDCNRFSEKWNAPYFDGWTVEMGISDLSVRLKMVPVAGYYRPPDGCTAGPREIWSE
jgi:hypothetical protein